MLEKEIWKDIYDGKYKISNYGRVWSRYNNGLLKLKTIFGYIRAFVFIDNKCKNLAPLNDRQNPVLAVSQLF